MTRVPPEFTDRKGLGLNAYRGGKGKGEKQGDADFLKGGLDLRIFVGKKKEPHCLRGGKGIPPFCLEGGERKGMKP